MILIFINVIRLSLSWLSFLLLAVQVVSVSLAINFSSSVGTLMSTNN